MIGLLQILISLIFSAHWLSFIFGNREAKVLGLRYETLMFISIASAVLGFIFIRIGI
jgi:hypothetical protein